MFYCMNRKKPRKSQGNQNKLRRYFQYISADSKEHQQESHAKTEITKHLAVKPSRLDILQERRRSLSNGTKKSVASLTKGGNVVATFTSKDQ